MFGFKGKFCESSFSLVDVIGELDFGEGLLFYFVYALFVSGLLLHIKKSTFLKASQSIIINLYFLIFLYSNYSCKNIFLSVSYTS